MTTATPAKKTTRRKAAPAPAGGPAAAPVQAELAPAAGDAQSAPPDEARTAIATITGQLAQFDVAQAKLPDLRRKYTAVAYAVATKVGMEEAILARREIKGVRVDLEHARTAAKAPVLVLGRYIDSRAQTLTAELLALEKPIDDQIKAQELKEAQRKADLEKRITEIRNTPSQCIGKNSTQLQEVLDALESLPLADFQEYREQAARAQEGARQQVQQLLTTAKQAEQLAELQAAQKREDARKASIRQAIEAIGAALLQLPMCRTAARVQTLLDNVEAIEIAPLVYQEFAAEARERKAQVIADLVKARNEKKAEEDARAAAPAPTPAPSPAPAPARTTSEDDLLQVPLVRSPDGSLGVRADTVDGLPPSATRIYPDEPRESYVRSSHDRINDEGAARLHEQFGKLPGPGRSLNDDFRRVVGGPRAAAPTEPEDPFSAPIPQGVMSMSDPQRPTDAEILAVLADHYDVDAATAAGWLRTFDAAAALAQQPLIPTT